MTWLTKILNGASYKAGKTLVVVVYDEDQPNHSPSDPMSVLLPGPFPTTTMPVSRTPRSRSGKSL